MGHQGHRFRRDDFRSRLADQSHSRGRLKALLARPAKQSEVTAPAEKAFFPEGALRVGQLRTPDQAGHGTHLPWLLNLLVSMAVGGERPKAPTCVVLPSTDEVAEAVAALAAIEWLSLDHAGAAPDPAAHLGAPGSLVRFMENRRVYRFGGVEIHDAVPMIRLKWVSTNGRDIKSSVMTHLWRGVELEPTTMMRPVGRQGDHRPSKEGVSSFHRLDRLAGTRIHGNPGLIRNHVVLIGSPPRFRRFLETLALMNGHGREGGPATLSPGFPWGVIDDDGRAVVKDPDGSAGSPMVALTRRADLMKAATLADGRAPGSHLVVTDSIRFVLENLDAASRVAERQRFILFAASRLRHDIMALRNRGWIVIEPGPDMILPEGERANFQPLPGLHRIDRVRRAAAAELARRTGWLEARSDELAAAWPPFDHLMSLFETDLADAEEHVLDVAEDIRDLFFKSLRMLEAPMGDDRDDFLASIERIRGIRPNLRRAVGEDAAAAAGVFAESIESFIRYLPSGGCTPKGEELLRLARSADAAAGRSVFVAGTTQGRLQADAFLEARGVAVRCRQARDIVDGAAPSVVIAFSMMRPETFNALVDPWPSPHLNFMGYDFEIGIYRRRLERRDRMRREMLPDPDRLASMTGLDKALFPAGDHRPSCLEPPVDPMPELGPSDRTWNWSRPVRPPALREGETRVRATVLSFVGRSWMAVTDEHRLLAVEDGTADGRGETTVRHCRLADVTPGARIVIREAGGKSIIRALAERICGEDEYRSLSGKAARWRRAIELARVDAEEAGRRLRAAGLARHPATIRSWMSDHDRIGPQSQDDVTAIAEAFPVPGMTEASWKECWEAIGKIRRLHMAAGSRLTRILEKRCNGALLEPGEHEMMLDFGIGAVWIVEVRHVGERIQVPEGCVNRLQWTSSEWMRRMQADRVPMLSVD